MATLARWQRTIVDQAGNVMPGAWIEVRSNTIGGTPLVSLYSDRAGAVPLGNPFQADSNGLAAFHAAGDALRVRAYTGPSGAPTFEQIWPYVAHGTMAEQDSTSPIITGTMDVQEAIKLSGDITPPQVTSDQNDYAPTSFSTASVVRISTDASRNITGLAGGSDGRKIYIYNVGSFSVVLKDESASSAAANRFAFGADMTLAAKQGATLIYDGTASRWRQVGGPAAAGSGVTSVGSGDGLTGGPITTSGSLSIDPSFLRGYLAGLTLSTAGSSTTFSVAAGVAVDSGNTAFMKLASALSKTTGAWAVGSGNGSLDVGTIEASKWYHVYLIKRVDTGVVDVLASLSPLTAAFVTITIASPGVVTWANHGLQVNAPVVFLTTGTLPTGITAGTTYYVKTVVDANSFQVSATQGGAAINTSGSQSGTHSGFANPILPANYTLARRIGAMLTNGSSQWTKFVQVGDEFLLDTPVLDVNVANLGTSATTYTLASVPPGIAVNAIGNFGATNSNGQGVYVSSLGVSDMAASNTVAPGLSLRSNVNSAIGWSGRFMVRTNPSSQIRARGEGASTTFKFVTLGWIDQRGLDG